MRNYTWLWKFITITCFGLSAHAQPNLTYPKAPIDADQIAEQVHLVIHSGLLRNAVSRRNKEHNEVALIVNRAPLEKRRPGDRPSVSSFETFLNNSPKNPEVDSVRMAFITSGKSRGTGILLTSYKDPERSANLLMWLPTLRKIRRFNEPDPQDYWFGTTLTYGELVLRKPDDEMHEMLGEGELEGCLAAMELETSQLDRHTRNLPGPQCAHTGKPVYRLKSTRKRVDWWYDYHISEIDQQSFAPYRTVYYKGDKRIKTISVDWQPLGEGDPRIVYPSWIYSLLDESGRDSLVYIPRSTIQVNVDLPDRFWSELTLKKKAR